MADQITEEVLQLLYTAHQDLAELGTDRPVVDGGLLQSAQECTLGAISILRVVASTVLADHADPGATLAGERAGWEQTAAVLFNGMSDAWIVTCEARDLLFASEAACELLGRSSAELGDLMHEKHGWPTIVAGLPRTRGPAGETHIDIDVPLPTGELRAIHVESYALPAVESVRRSYISLLTDSRQERHENSGRGGG